MKKSLSKDVRHNEVFSPQEVDVFKKIFDRLSNNSSSMRLQSYVDHIKGMTKNKGDSVISTVIRDMEQEGDVQVDFSEFIRLLEDKVGNVHTSNGLQKIFTFITRDTMKKRISLEDLLNISKEIGLTVSDKDLQRLINFITVSYKERSDLTFEEFERYVLKGK